MAWIGPKEKGGGGRSAKEKGGNREGTDLIKRKPRFLSPKAAKTRDSGEKLLGATQFKNFEQ